MNQDRSIFEETVVNALMDNQYIFYAHIIASTVLNIDNKFPAPAGVAFIRGQFHLFLNMEMFKKYTLQMRKSTCQFDQQAKLVVHIGAYNLQLLHLCPSHQSRTRGSWHSCSHLLQL
jgi:hypothetical protein